MHNLEIANAFSELADRLALTDLKPYRWMAYRRAADTFRELPESIAVLSREGRLREVDGVGEAIEEKVEALLQTGTFPALEEAREQVSDTLLQLTRLPGIGPATARKVHAATEQASYASLLERAAAGTLQPADGLTPKVIATLADAAGRAHDETAGDEPAWFRRDQVEAVHDAIALLAGSEAPVTALGPWARGCELLQEAVVLVVASEPVSRLSDLESAALARGWQQDSSPSSATTELLALLDAAAVHPTSLTSPTGVPATIVCTAQQLAVQARHVLAGPAAWIEREPTPGSSAVPHELRERVLDGLLDPGAIPHDLLQASDVRGELHVHSTWSDGRASIHEMAQAARARGDAYICITDHSAPYALVNGLDIDRLRAQAEEIARVNEQLANEHAGGAAPMRVLHGTELEILADGSLGLPDEALELLDWVVASIHTQQRQDADVILERMRRVCANPLVDAIGHPTSRRLLVRGRTALDVDALIDLAHEQGIALEINANPERLDLDSTHAATAIAAGVRLTINTDAHSVSMLAHRPHGIAVARRAGVRTGQVVNCLTADELLAGRRRNR